MYVYEFVDAIRPCIYESCMHAHTGIAYTPALNWSVGVHQLMQAKKSWVKFERLLVVVVAAAVNCRRGMRICCASRTSAAGSYLGRRPSKVDADAAQFFRQG
jgi:hypothetical protein